MLADGSWHRIDGPPATRCARPVDAWFRVAGGRIQVRDATTGIVVSTTIQRQRDDGFIGQLAAALVGSLRNEAWLRTATPDELGAEVATYDTTTITCEHQHPSAADRDGCVSGSWGNRVIARLSELVGGGG